MPTLIDLSIPVRHGDGRLGLEVAFSTPYSYENCGWQGSSFSMFAHYATHVDAPNHFIQGAKGIDEAPVTKVMGAASLVPLDDHGAARAITADTLEDRGRHVRRGEDCAIHHRILGEEIYNIEYVHQLAKIRAPRCAILALPLKLAGLDGAPARVVAIEGMEFPAEFTVTT